MEVSGHVEYAVAFGADSFCEDDPESCSINWNFSTGYSLQAPGFPDDFFAINDWNDYASYLDPDYQTDEFSLYFEGNSSDLSS